MTDSSAPDPLLADPVLADPVLVVLAAGASSRLGQPKALVELGGPGDFPLARLLGAGGGFRERLVVSGAHADAIGAALSTLGETAVHLPHPDWERGRTGSVQRAIAQRPDRDLCLAPVDVPLVPGEVFEGLRLAWDAAGRPARGWLAPCVTEAGDAGGEPGKKFGHPVFLGRDLAAELAGWAPDRPLFELRELAEPLLAFEVGTRAILEDLDGPGDLARIRASL